MEKQLDFKPMNSRSLGLQTTSPSHWFIFVSYSERDGVSTWLAYLIECGARRGHPVPHDEHLIPLTIITSHDFQPYSSSSRLPGFLLSMDT